MPSAPKPPRTWMPLYVGDYMADTISLTPLQHGHYLLAIMAYWRRGGPLPAAEATAILGPEAEALAHFFNHDDPALWRHSRIDAELAKAADMRENLSRRGQRGAAARWPKDATAMPEGWLKDATANAQAMLADAPSPSPSQKEEAAARARASPEDGTNAPDDGAALTDLGNKVLTAAKIDPARWLGDFREVLAWQAASLDVAKDVIPVVQAIAARQNYRPPKSLKYFTAMILEAKQGLAKPNGRGNGTHNGGTDTMAIPMDQDPIGLKAIADAVMARKRWIADPSRRTSVEAAIRAGLLTKADTAWLDIHPAV